MKNIVVGKIVEYKNNDKVFYRISFYDGRMKKDIESKDEMFDFITDESKKLFKNKQTSKIAIRYYNLERISHYIVIKENDGELVIGEQSSYEYHEAQSYFFPKHVNRRLVDDRHYDFSDMVRSSANFRLSSMWFKVFILLLTMFISIITFIDSLDTLTDANMTHLIGNKITYRVFLYGNLLVSFAFGAISIMALFYANAVYKKENDGQGDYDFRSATLRRQMFRLINLSLQTIGVIFLSLILVQFTEGGLTQTWTPLPVLIVVNLGIAVIAVFIQILYILFTKINLRKNFRKYYPKESFSVFKEWYKLGETKELASKRDIFLLDDNSSLVFYTQEIKTLKNVLEKDEKDDLKIIAKKLITNAKNSVSIRKKELNK